MNLGLLASGFKGDKKRSSVNKEIQEGSTNRGLKKDEALLIRREKY